MIFLWTWNTPSIRAEVQAPSEEAARQDLARLNPKAANDLRDIQPTCGAYRPGQVDGRVHCWFPPLETGLGTGLGTGSLS